MSWTLHLVGVTNGEEPEHVTLDVTQKTAERLLRLRELLSGQDHVQMIEAADGTAEWGTTVSGSPEHREFTAAPTEVPLKAAETEMRTVKVYPSGVVFSCRPSHEESTGDVESPWLEWEAIEKMAKHDGDDPPEGLFNTYSEAG